MNILRKTRKSLNRISKKRLLLVIFSLIMTSFAWIAYSKILSPALEVKIASWNVKFFVDANKNMVAEDFEEQTASKDSPGATGRSVEVAINNLYPGMDEDIIDVIIRNDGEVPSGITYGINNITMLGVPYELGTDIVEHTPTFEDGIQTYEFINQLEKFPFKITIENTELVRNGAEGYLKVRVLWPLEKTGSQTDDIKNTLDTKWGYGATEYVETEGAAPIKFNLQIYATGSDPDVVDYAENSFVSKVTPENYGDEVNYGVDLDGNASTNDWVIFCEHRNNVYLIAKDYIENSFVSNSEMTPVSGSDYRINWSDLADLETSSITSKMKNKYMLTQASVSEKANWKATASLLTSEYWYDRLKDVEGYADTIIGGPTIEMFVKSWNQKFITNPSYQKLKCVWDEDKKGYAIGTLSGELVNVLSLTKDTNTELYFANTIAEDSNCNCYWIASPTSAGEYSLIRVSNGGEIKYNGYSNELLAVRPVVCIKETVKASKSGDVWLLGEE